MFITLYFSHLLEILNPKDCLDIQQISKFKELRKVSYIKKLKVQIYRFLPGTGKIFLHDSDQNTTHKNDVFSKMGSMTKFG
jgi:hypothetical protein